jgi:hypothetical protein
MRPRAILVNWLMGQLAEAEQRAKIFEHWAMGSGWPLRWHGLGKTHTPSNEGTWRKNNELEKAIFDCNSA